MPKLAKLAMVDVPTDYRQFLSVDENCHRSVALITKHYYTSTSAFSHFYLVRHVGYGKAPTRLVLKTLFLKGFFCSLRKWARGKIDFDTHSAFL